MTRNGAEGQVSNSGSDTTGTLSITVRRDTRHRSPPRRHAARPWVVAYGVRRGNRARREGRQSHRRAAHPLQSAGVAPRRRPVAQGSRRRRPPRATKRPAQPLRGPHEGVWRSVQHALGVLTKVGGRGASCSSVTPSSTGDVAERRLPHHGGLG